MLYLNDSEKKVFEQIRERYINMIDAKELQFYQMLKMMDIELADSEGVKFATACWEMLIHYGYLEPRKVKRRDNNGVMSDAIIHYISPRLEQFMREQEYVALEKERREFETEKKKKQEQRDKVIKVLFIPIKTVLGKIIAQSLATIGVIAVLYIAYRFGLQELLKKIGYLK